MNTILQEISFENDILTKKQLNKGASFKFKISNFKTIEEGSDTVKLNLIKVEKRGQIVLSTIFQEVKGKYVDYIIPFRKLDSGTYKIVLEDKEDSYEYEFKLKKDLSGLILSIVAFLIVAIGILLWILFKPEIAPVVDNPKLAIEDAEDWDGQSPKSGKESQASDEQLEFRGYSNYYLSEKNPSIPLINPKGNTAYFKYVIKNGDTTIAETDLIAPDKMVEKDLYKALGKGTYNLVFYISTYDLESQAPCNTLSNEVKVVLE